MCEFEEDDNIGNRVEEKKAVITFECSKEQKNLFVRAAKPGKLIDWIISTLTKEASNARHDR
jgi:hypothetical protein